MRKILSLVAMLCLTTVSAFATMVNVPDAEYTSLSELEGKTFAIVNTAEGKALYGTNNQNLGYDTYEMAFKASNTGYMWKAVYDADSQAYYLQLVTPSGADYNCWGMGGVLNSQGEAQGWACSFILGTNGAQKGQDIPNGALYNLTYETEGWTIKNVGTGMYQPYSTKPANSTEPTYWTFCSLKEVDNGVAPETFELPASVKSLVENGTQFFLMSGDKYLIGGDQQAVVAATWEEVAAASNSTMWVLTENEDGSGLFRAVTAEGANVSAWGANPCYLNSQPNVGGVLFKMNKDQDFTNGSSWIVAEGEGGYTLQCVGNKGYATIGCNTSADAAIWQIVVPVEAPVVAIEEGEGTLTVTSTTEDALYYLCKPMTWLDEDETPESVLMGEIEGMASMIDSEDTWEMYGHMGMEPAPKTFTLADYAAMYAGQEMFLIAANVGWDGEKLGVISNIVQTTFTVPEAQGAWDGTVTTSLDEAVVTSIEDFANMTITFPGAANITTIDEENMGYLALQNEDGSELYGIWSPLYGSEFTIDGNTITIDGFMPMEGATVAIPAGTTKLVICDYGTLNVDGEDIYMDDIIINANVAGDAQPFMLTAVRNNNVFASVVGVEASEQGVSKCFSLIAKGKTLSVGTATPTLTLSENADVDFGEATVQLSEDGNSDEIDVLFLDPKKDFFTTPGTYVLYVPEGTVVDAEGNPNAATAVKFVVIEQDVPTGINGIGTLKDGKFVKNGKVIIIKNGKVYTTVGTVM